MIEIVVKFYCLSSHCVSLLLLLVQLFYSVSNESLHREDFVVEICIFLQSGNVMQLKSILNKK